MKRSFWMPAGLILVATLLLAADLYWRVQARAQLAQTSGEPVMAAPLASPPQATP